MRKINPAYTLERVKSDYGLLGYEIAVTGQNGIICQFDSVYTAALVARFFSGASLRSYEKDSVLMALDRYDKRVLQECENVDQGDEKEGDPG